VRVGGIARAVPHLSLFIQRRLLEEITAETGFFQRISVQVRKIPRNGGFRVIPRTLPDAITGIDGRLIAASLRAEIGVPGMISRSDRGGQRLAVGVGSGQSAEIAPFADSSAGYKESQRMPLQRILPRPSS
jgi:hypothetical protein